MICTPFYLSASSFAGAAPASKLPASRIAAARMPEPIAVTALTEEEAKAAWLARVDQTTWGKAASAISEVAADAAQFAALTKQCDAGKEVACDALSKEDEAKKAWLAKIDVPAWGKAATVVTELASVAAMMPDDAAAKAAWLAKIDVPKWGPAAEVIIGVMADAAQFAECDAGVAAEEVECAPLSEDEAKRAWLAKLDLITWGDVAQTVAVGLQVAEAKDEAAAKAAWLASLDQEPSWRR